MAKPASAEPEQQPHRAAAATAVAAAAVAARSGSGEEGGGLLAVPAAAARATALATVLGALVGFLATQRARLRAWLVEQMRRRQPSASETAVEALVAEEERRGEEFARRQAVRMARDVAVALAIPDPEQRAAAMRGITSREARYARQRDEAMAARAFAAVDRWVLKVESPQGAFWRLDPTVVEHTAGCLIMGGKFWPWVVLDRVHPPRHGGCPCRLISYGAAISEGLLAPGAVMDVATAVRAAAQVVMEGVLVLAPDDADALIEDAGGRDALALRAALLEHGMVDDVGALDALLSEFDPQQPRWPKGHPRAGQWRPKVGAGGTGKRSSAGWMARDFDELRALAGPRQIAMRWDDEKRADVPVMGSPRSTAELAQIGASVAKLAERYGTWHADRERITALHAERMALGDAHRDRVDALGGRQAWMARWRKEEQAAGREGGLMGAVEAMDALRPPAEGERMRAIDTEVSRLLVQEERGKREAYVGVLAQVREMGGALRASEVTERGGGSAQTFDESLRQVRALLPAAWLESMSMGDMRFELSTERAWHLLDGSGGVSPSAARARQERRIDAMLDEGGVFVGYDATGAPVIRSPGEKKHTVFLPEDAGLYRLSANGVSEPVPEGVQVKAGARRGWRPGSTIRVRAGDPATLLHELLHRAELVHGEQGVDGYRPVLRATLRLLRERAGDSDTVKLADLQPGSGYGADEVTWEDEFPDPYFGKSYGGRVTEILTMGLQTLFYPTYSRTFAPGKHNTRAKRDDELRDFLLGAMVSL